MRVGFCTAALLFAASAPGYGATISSTYYTGNGPSSFDWEFQQGRGYQITIYNSGEPFDYLADPMLIRFATYDPFGNLWAADEVYSPPPIAFEQTDWGWVAQFRPMTVTDDNGWKTFWTYAQTQYRFHFDPGAGTPFNIRYDVFDAVPETATWSLLIVGFGLLGAALRRQQAYVPLSS